MSWQMRLLLGALGLVGGVISGTLGIGGGIVMAPLLLYGPALFSLGQLDMKTVSGLTMVQSLFASLSGALVHRKLAHVQPRLAVIMGAAIAASSFAGALASRALSSDLLLATFATLALLAAAMMAVPSNGGEREVAAQEVPFNPGLAAATATGVGLVGGMVGQSGAFILVPLLIHALKVPTRVAIGTSLVVVFCAASAGTLGKIAAGQVPLSAAAALGLGAVAGARLGGNLTERVDPKWLRRALALLIGASAVQMWTDVLG